MMNKYFLNKNFSFYQSVNFFYIFVSPKERMKDGPGCMVGNSDIWDALNNCQVWD